MCVYSGFIRGSDGVGETPGPASDPFIRGRGRWRPSLLPQLPSLPRPQCSRALILFFNLSLRPHHLPTACMGKNSHSHSHTHTRCCASLFLLFHALYSFFLVTITILQLYLKSLHFLMTALMLTHVTESVTLRNIIHTHVTIVHFHILFFEDG